MDFDLSEEQRLLKESLDRLIGDRYDFEQRKTLRAEAERAGAARCGHNIAELACSGCPSQEQHGGSAGGPVETMIAWKRSAAALCSSRIFATVVLGGGFLRHGGSAEQCAESHPEDRRR